MEMIVLNREMENPEAAVGGHGKRAAHGREDSAGSEATDGPPATEGHMHRVRSDVRGSGVMRDAGAATGG